MDNKDELFEENRSRKWDDARLRDKVGSLIKNRLELVDEKELVRRATTLFALPPNNITGLKLIWETADIIWKLADDTSDDINWYTKRTCLLYTSPSPRDKRQSRMPSSA